MLLQKWTLWHTAKFPVTDSRHNPCRMNIDVFWVLEAKYYMETGPELFKSAPNTLGSWFGIMCPCKKSVLGNCSLYACHILRFLEMFSEISTSTNKFRPGTCFEMCSGAWEHGRLQHHQKLLARKWSYGFSKLQHWILGHSSPGTNSILFWKPIQTVSENFWAGVLSVNQPSVCFFQKA